MVAFCKRTLLLYLLFVSPVVLYFCLLLFANTASTGKAAHFVQNYSYTWIEYFLYVELVCLLFRLWCLLDYDVLMGVPIITVYDYFIIQNYCSPSPIINLCHLWQQSSIISIDYCLLSTKMIKPQTIEPCSLMSDAKWRESWESKMAACKQCM